MQHCPACGQELWHTERQPLTGLSGFAIHPGRRDFDERQVLEGHVVSTSSLKGPVSGLSCVGFGLSGMAGAHVVHDACVAAFELEVDDQPVWVAPAVALLDAAPGTPRELEARPHDALGRFLRGRGLPALGLELSEVLIREGDLLRVEGDLSTRRDARVVDGYRRSTHTVLLEGDADRPLIVSLLS
jgi:hypothetical protein